MSKDEILKYLELQEQGYRVNREIAEQLGYGGKQPERGLRQDLRRNGYNSVGDGYYTKKDSCDDNIKHDSTDTLKNNTVRTNSNTSGSTTVHTEKSITNKVDKGEDNSEYKSNTLDDATIKKLLTIADKYDNIMSITSSNTSSVTNTIPKESIHNACKDAVGVSIKVDHEVWKKFKKYAKLSDYKQQDLITVALEMLMKSDL